MPQKQRAKGRASVPDVFRTVDVARILGVKPRRVRAMVHAGFCVPGRRGLAFEFNFQDLLLLRTAQGLSRGGVPFRRVKRALGQLKLELPADRPLSGLRIYADGHKVTVREGRKAWEPESGQRVFVFDVDDLEHETRVLVPPATRRSPVPARARGAESAHEWFERGLALEGDDARAARAAYRKAIEIDPSLSDAYVNLGRLHHQLGDVAAAIVLYRQGLQHAADDPVIHYNLALALEDAKESDSALAHYDHAVHLDPNFADAHFNLGRLLEALGRHEQALRHLLAYRRLTKKK